VALFERKFATKLLVTASRFSLLILLDRITSGLSWMKICGEAEPSSLALGIRSARDSALKLRLGCVALHSFSDWRMLPLVNVFGLKSTPEWLGRKLEMFFPEDAVGLLEEDAKREFAVKSRLQGRIWYLGQVREC
jgi:hypothetical protein